MQTSGIPARVAVPFADSGTKNTIPVPSQVAVTPGLASYTTGFPPLTMTPITAGGVPPYGADFNGILNDITKAIRWNSAGSGYPFDSTFASAVAGYPKGALVPASDYSGYWINTTEANSISPENTTAATTGWVPGVHYGTTSITGLAAASVTLSTLQAAKPRITLAGTLTANINLVFPAWIRSWAVVNNCTGNFSVTCKTPSGTGVSIPSGLSATINGDGTNITQDANILGISGRLLNIQVFTSSGTYTPTAGTKTIKVKALGGGGGGGGTAITSGTQVSSASGGNGGSYGESTLINATTASGTAVTVGAGGSGVPGASGTNGGASSFGAYLSSPGGTGGASGGASSSSGSLARDGIAQSTSSGSSVAFSTPGAVGGGPIALSNAAGAVKSGKGGDTLFGSGGAGITGSFTAVSGTGFGAGGGGNAVGTGAATTIAGGAGSPGIIIVEEYA